MFNNSSDRGRFGFASGMDQPAFNSEEAKAFWEAHKDGRPELKNFFNRRNNDDHSAFEGWLR